MRERLILSWLILVIGSTSVIKWFTYLTRLEFKSEGYWIIDGSEQRTSWKRGWYLCMLFSTV